MYSKIKNLTISRDTFQVETMNGKLFTIESDVPFNWTDSNQFEYSSNGITLRINRKDIPQFEIHRDSEHIVDSPMMSVYAPRELLRSIKSDLKRNGIFNLNHRKHIREKYKV